MTPSFLDHLIAFVLIGVLPLVARWTYPRNAEKMRADPETRLSSYRWTVMQQWAFVAVVLGVWFAYDRDWAAIGLVVPSGIQTYVGIAITVAVVIALRVQLAQVRRGGEASRAALRAQLGSTDALMPRNAREMRWFGAMSVTAGVCEEVLFRGFLIAYLATLVGTWPAVVAAAAVFGFAHLYQGGANALKGAVFALLAGILYLGCGSLLWPMIAHAAIDITGGMLGRLAMDGPTTE
jgi:membrane protease YdiL (CAAX protease family)